MNMNQLASELCKREGKKKQVSIGNMREIVGVLCDVIYENPGATDWFRMFLDNGAKRAKRTKARA